MTRMATDSTLTGRAEDQAATMRAALEALVTCESPSNNPAALNRCADLLADLGTATISRAPQRLTVDGHPHLLWEPLGEPKVLILGHLDTVWPIGTITDWPFHIEDGIARGPGVFDMKAGLVIALTAIGLLGNPDGIGLLITSDEEIGSATSRALIEQHARAAGAVLVCEPSADGGAVKNARKGVADYELRITGHAAHAGLEPELGINATIELAHQVLAVAAIARPDLGTTVTPTTMTAGTTGNTVPERAAVHLDARAWTRAEMDRVDQELRRLHPHLPGAIVTLHGKINRYPFEAHSAAHLLAAAQDAARHIGQPNLTAVRSGGASDGNITAGLGIATLDGLGAIGAHPHARSEQVHIPSMPTRAALLAATLDRVLAQNSDTLIDRGCRGLPFSS